MFFFKNHDDGTQKVLFLCTKNCPKKTIRGQHKLEIHLTTKISTILHCWAWKKSANAWTIVYCNESASLVDLKPAWRLVWEKTIWRKMWKPPQKTRQNWTLVRQRKVFLYTKEVYSRYFEEIQLICWKKSNKGNWAISLFVSFTKWRLIREFYRFYL